MEGNNDGYEAEAHSEPADIEAMKARIRSSVEHFGEQMITVLERHIPQKGVTWDTDKLGWLIDRMKEEAQEVDDEHTELVIPGPPMEDRGDVPRRSKAAILSCIQEEAIDVANMAMMVCERAGRMIEEERQKSTLRGDLH